MKNTTKKLFYKISGRIIGKKDLFPSISILLLADTLLIIGYCFIFYFAKANLNLSYLLITCAAIIKVIITFYFCQELSYSKYSKIGYALFFFLYFWPLCFTTLSHLTNHFSKMIDPFYLFNYPFIFLLNLLGIFCTQWLISHKPWVHILTDLLSLLILIPIFNFDNLPKILITPFILIFTAIRYVTIIKFLSRKFSLFFEERCLIIGELLSFYIFLIVIAVVSEPRNFSIASLAASLFVYLLTLYARILLFITYSFKKKETKVFFSMLVIFVSMTSLVAFLLSVLPGEKGTNIITLILPAIIPIIFQSFSTRNNQRKQIIFLNKFHDLKNLLTILFFYTTILINILANLISAKRLPLPFLPNGLKTFYDYLNLVMYSVIIGVFLAAISQILFLIFFENPKNGYIKIISSNRKFRHRLHKR
ncbi:hypothetical protein ACVR0O_09795 [Streptococcus caviae]|uniref:hypothetical protein n=1 Tax=Streptococcus sp. 'caviae' TaxID=1915004 RepID=UPI00094B9173|nr:hypothetical protein [Streptococcus sp. 'caviae']OLN82288.1 hypothetical protein BMI76_09900 [Streptococcus sp. 'caviae']